MKVLVPVSGAGDAKLILDFIANHIWPPGCEFRTLHVLSYPTETNEAPTLADEYSAGQLVDAVSERISSLISGCKANGEVFQGAPIATILESAKDWAPDMIVMGYRSRGSSQRYLAGSVSRSISMQAPCSVVVVRPPDWQPQAQQSQTKTAMTPNVK